MRERLAAHGQEHVLRFWDRLSAAERETLAGQLERLDLDALRAALEAATAPARRRPPKLAPLPAEAIPECGGDPERHARAAARGEDLLREGRVAALVVAGGQATRLGYPGPKGGFPIGPVTDRTLFEIQAQKLRRAGARAGRPVPWVVMTSQATDGPTRELFAAHGSFGLDEGQVHFFRQGMVPSFDFEGRLVLAEPGRLMENPDGHGGSLTALLESGTLDRLEERGITTLFYYQVDNPLVRMVDPGFLGFHADAGADVSCKVVRKVDPAEKVGLVAEVNGAPGVVEYTEIDDEHRLARDAGGELVYWAGNIAIHVFDTVFVRRIAGEADRWLPFHASEKKLPTVDEAGRTVVPDAPNGRKLERFVFDALPAAERVCVVETSRALEFSPVKNAEGVDSPATARRDLVAQYRSWLEAAGLAVPPDCRLEIDHSRVDSERDARAMGWRDLSETGDIVRMEPGASA